MNIQTEAVCPNCRAMLIEECNVGIVNQNFIIDFDAHCSVCNFRFSWRDEHAIFPIGDNVHEKNSCARSVPAFNRVSAK
jgi:hypothetical protein